MKECSKSVMRRLGDSNFTRHYFVGRGLDVGGRPDPLNLYRELFCRMESVRTWDWEDGDGQLLAGVPNDEFDFVHSSHCLEHLEDPAIGLRNWFRVVREGGYMIVTVPDEDLYEQGQFPSTFNRDHKWTFTIWKSNSWSERSINVLDMLRTLSPAAEVVKLEQLNASYRYELPRFDQTLSPVGECGIEFVVRKRPAMELAAGGRWQRTSEQPEREVRLSLNQYKDDMSAMKMMNQGSSPFSNDSDL
jgi:SAM-dependent methyltransferase